jgi:adenine/guanine/hypoxanthine permease
LAAVTTGVLLALALFFLLVIEPLQKLKFTSGPTLIAGGVLMIDSIRQVRFDGLTELVPALVTITMMPITFNIGNGLTAGLVVCPVM